MKGVVLPGGRCASTATFSSFVVNSFITISRRRLGTTLTGVAGE
jgi:hypothetical protein